MLKLRRYFDAQATNKVGGNQAAESETTVSQRRMDHMQDAVSVLNVN